MLSSLALHCPETPEEKPLGGGTNVWEGTKLDAALSLEVSARALCDIQVFRGFLHLSPENRDMLLIRPKWDTRQ